MAVSNAKYSRLDLDSPGSELSDYTSAFDYGTRFIDNKSFYKSIYSYSNDFLNKDEDFDLGNPENWPSYLCRMLIVFIGHLLFIITLPISYWVVIKKLDQNERLIIFRLGRIQSAKGPGRIIVLPYIDSWKKVNIRTRAFSIPPQQVIITGGAVIEIGAEVQYHIKDAVKSVSKVKDLDGSTRMLAQTLFVNFLCKSSLDDLNCHKQQIATSFQSEINELTSKWGLIISRLEMSQLKVHKQPEDATQPVVNAIQGMFAGRNNGDSNNYSSSPVLNEDLFPGNDDFATSKNNDYYIQLLRKKLNRLSDLGASDLSAVYRLEIIENNSSIEIFLVISNGAGHAVRKEDLSADIKADVSVSMFGRDLEDMLSGSLSPLQAYISGDIKVTGNIQLLMLFQDLLNKQPKIETIIDI
ncbi:Stomatin-like protein 1 [Nymphon striatum]|nr:Stomatin-like protein 1 [Nymphon striatum]